MKTCFFSAICLGFMSSGFSAELLPVPAEKRGYTLFNPTPRERMRPMSTDRPDKTESPYTVDAGHFQIETDLANFSRESDSGVRTENWSFLHSNFKMGLCNSADLQLIVPTHNLSRVKSRSAGTSQQSGFGDVMTRLKINLWGNDEGQTAFAVMPFVKFPTARDNLGNGAFEGGIIFPFAVALPKEWNCGLMTEIDWSEDADGRGYHPEFINTITFSRSIIGGLGGYVEFFSLVSTDNNSSWVATFDLGLTYAMTPDVQLDGGVNIGMTRSADDLNPFVGISWRF